MKNLINKIKGKTPLKGKALAGFGLSIAGFGASVQFAPTEVISLIPEEHRIYFAIAMEVIGLVLAIYGGSRTINPSSTSNPE